MTDLFNSKFFPREDLEDSEKPEDSLETDSSDDNKEEDLKEPEEHPLKVFFKELDLKDEDKREDVINKITAKLNLSHETLCEGISAFVKDHAEEFTLEMLNIAPYGEYESLIEDEDNMAEFLKKEAVKLDNWKLVMIEPVSMDTSLIKFMYHNVAVDEGEVLRGFAIVSLSGKVRHAFANVDV